MFEFLKSFQKKQKQKNNIKATLINNLAEGKEITLNFDKIKTIKIIDNKIIANGILSNNELARLLDSFAENEVKENFFK